MIRIIHVSDLHIGKDLLFPSPGHEARRKKLLESVAAAFPAPNASTYLLVTGDIVDDGIKKEYLEAKRSFGAFSGRVLVCLGNHDYGRDGMIFEPQTVDRFLWLWAAVSGQVAPVEQGGGYAEENGVYHCLIEDGSGVRALLIGLDTCLRRSLVEAGSEFTKEWALTNAVGSFTEAQEKRVGELVKQFEGVPKLLYLHHDPTWNEWWMGPWMLLLRGERVLTLKGIDVILHGHSGQAVQVDSLLKSRQAQVRTLLEKKPGIRVERILRADGKRGAFRVDANACVDQQKWVQIDIDRDGVHYPEIKEV
jgi:3',5'-cyclic AMP phosphodiesterase CpdA